MTRPSTRRHDRTAVPTSTASDDGSRTTRWVVAVAFWTAVALPLVHVPLLVVRPVTGGRALLVVALVALNALALVVGYPHRRDGGVGG